MSRQICRYGNEMVLSHEGQHHTIRAFLQDARSTSKDNARRDFSPLGELFKGRYVYIGPAEPAATVGDTLRYQGRVFELRRAELVAVNNAPAYCWGLCVEKGGDGTWGS